MKSRSLRTFLFKPLEIAFMLAFMLFLVKVAFKLSSVVFSWWTIGMLVLIVPILFALLFGAIYLLTWIFNIANQEVPE
ncbi:MAG: hypothetical protein ABI772_04150 [Bacteroidota bacterium]